MNALVRLTRANGQMHHSMSASGRPQWSAGSPARSSPPRRCRSRRALHPGRPRLAGRPGLTYGTLRTRRPRIALRPRRPGFAAACHACQHDNDSRDFDDAHGRSFFADRSVRQARQSAARVSVANGSVTARTPFQDCRFEPNALTNRPRRCRSAEASTATRHL